MPTSSHIGTLTEKSLHAALKAWYAQPGDKIEIKVDNFVIDIVRDELLIEIQTRSFSALKRKFNQLLDRYKIHLLHPICREKWIVRQTSAGEFIQRRKSPKRGHIADVFRELVYIPHLISHANLTLEVLFTQEEEIWRDDGQGSWRRKGWSMYDRRLLSVVESATFTSTSDWCTVLPSSLPPLFSNQDLATTLKIRPTLAQKMSYTLRKMELISVVGKQGNAFLHEVAC